MSILGVNSQENRFGNGLNAFRRIVLRKGDPPSTQDQIIATREHPIYRSRKEQLGTNLLGLRGGTPYVSARLSRFAGEDEVDWSGGERAGGTNVTGRLQQAHCIPYLGRISDKINQFVLGTSPGREHIDPEIGADITAQGESIDAFMRRVNELVTAQRWCWIKVDGPRRDPRAGEMSQAEKDSSKVRPYWTLLNALEVVDWYINEHGVQWVMTETVDYMGSDPRTQGKTQIFRKLWEPGLMSWYAIDPDEPEKITARGDVELSLQDFVPFIPIGTISASPYLFDSLESINRTIMDLESCNRQNFFNTVFPQKFIPMSAIQNMTDAMHIDAETAVKRVVGYNFPILVGQDDKPPGYIMPDASSIGKIRDELSKLKEALFETVGLMLRQDTKQVASADSKAWDFLDVKQVMEERANLLEDAENKAVKLSKMWDQSWTEWVPQYNRNFESIDFEKEMRALTLVENMTLPDGLQKAKSRRVFDIFHRKGMFESGADTDAILQEIEDMSFENILSTPQTELSNDG